MVYHANNASQRVVDFEVDSTESVWYTSDCCYDAPSVILKLTPQSQYGISSATATASASDFEVDSTESVWYKRTPCYCSRTIILKLTPQSQYGIDKMTATHTPFTF